MAEPLGGFDPLAFSFGFKIDNPNDVSVNIKPILTARLNLGKQSVNITNGMVSGYGS